MSVIDWPGLLASLEEQRDALDEERADIDAVIETVRKRAGLKAKAAAAPSAGNGAKHPHPRTGEPAKKAGPGIRVDDAALAPIRKQYEAGVPITQIAEHSGKSEAAIYYFAKARKWSARSPTPKGTQLAGSVKYTNPDCGVMTDYDPCRRCGVTLKRKW